MAWFNFRKNNEKRSAGEGVTVTTSTNDTNAISLVFGKYTAQAQSRSLSAVFRSVSLISNSIASLPVQLLKYDSATETMRKAKEHSLYKILLKKPDNLLSSFDFWNCIITDVLLKGNGYAVIERDGLTVKALHYVPASKVNLTKKVDNNGQIVKVLYNIMGYKRALEAYEVIHIKNIPSEDGTEGISTLDFSRDCIALAASNQKAATNLYEVGGKPSGIITVSGPVTTKTEADIRRKWNESVGRANAGGVAILSDVTSFSPVTMDPASIEMLDSRKYSVEEIGRFFNVPGELLFTGGTYGSTEAMSLLLLTQTLAPIITKCEIELENKLLTSKEADEYEIRFDTENFTKADSKSRAEYFRTLWNFGVLSISEIRAKLGLPKVDSEETDGAAQHYVPAQMVTLKNSQNLGAEATGAFKVDNKLKIGEQKKAEEEK